MNIEKYKRQRTGFYKVFLEDGSSFLLHEDLILKHNLLIKKCIDEDELLSLQSENNDYVAYDKALKHLSTRSRSVFEIRKFLKDKEVSPLEIDRVVEKLINQGYLNDELYCKAFINDRILLSNYGPNKIIKELKENFIKDEIIYEDIKMYTEEIEREKIVKQINKLIKTNHNKGSFILKQKILHYLMDNGFNKSYILDELDNIEIDDSNNYRVEYQKLYNKLSKKYNGSELEYQIKQKLYQKGFKAQ